MKNLLLFPFKLVKNVIKGAAAAVALVLLASFLLPGQTQTEVTQLLSCTSCHEKEQEIAELQQQLDDATTALNAEHLILRRLDLRFLPELGWDWLRIRTFSWWDDTSAKHFEQFPEGTSETIWTSGFLECSLTTLERCCNE